MPTIVGQVFVDDVGRRHEVVKVWQPDEWIQDREAELRALGALPDESYFRASAGARNAMYGQSTSREREARDREVTRLNKQWDVNR